MASPQLEEGFVAIAYDLYLAIAAAKLLPIEKDVLHIIIYLTYGTGRTKAAIRADDVQILLTVDRRIRLERVEAAIASLIEKNLLYTSGTNNSLIGVQKDFEKWTDGSSPSGSESGGHGVQVIAKAIKLSTNTNSFSTSTNRDVASRLQEYAYRNSEFHYGPSAWGVERRFAKLLYREALTLTGDPHLAAVALKDYIDELKAQEWFTKVKMRFRYMHSRFRQWYKSIPAKPRSVREDEQITGYRHKYDEKTKSWRMSDEQIKPAS